VAEGSFTFRDAAFETRYTAYRSPAAMVVLAVIVVKAEVSFVPDSGV